jgi:putative ABC transport system ATP-binding protein
MPAIEVRGLTKRYRPGEESAVTALDDVSLTIQAGEFVSLVGRSGSGKTTLVHAMGLLLRPTSGQVLVDGIDTSELTDGERAELRGRRIGFVFEDRNLVAGLTVLENVVLPLRYEGFGRGGRKRARELLDTVGIGDRADDRPDGLTPGQAQRAALARALIKAPSLVLADEPTGAVDDETSDELLYVMQQINRTRSVTFVVATQDVDVASCLDRMIRLGGGRVVSDKALMT